MMALPSFKEKVRTTGLIDFSNPGSWFKKALTLINVLSTAFLRLPKVRVKLFAVFLVRNQTFHFQ